MHWKAELFSVELVVLGKIVETAKHVFWFWPSWLFQQDARPRLRQELAGGLKARRTENTVLLKELLLAFVQKIKRELPYTQGLWQVLTLPAVAFYFQNRKSTWFWRNLLQKTLQQPFIQQPVTDSERQSVDPRPTASGNRCSDHTAPSRIILYNLHSPCDWGGQDGRRVSLETPE